MALFEWGLRFPGFSSMPDARVAAALLEKLTAMAEDLPQHTCSNLSTILSQTPTSLPIIKKSDMMAAQALVSLATCFKSVVSCTLSTDDWRIHVTQLAERNHTCRRRTGMAQTLSSTYNLHMEA